MSTEISGQEAARGDILQAMPSRQKPTAPQETLGQFVDRLMREQGLNPFKIEKLSEEAGEKLGNQWIGKIAGDAIPNPAPEKLYRLSRYLNCSPFELFAVAAGVTTTEDPRYNESLFRQLHETYEKLSDEDKRTVMPLLEMVRGEINRRLKR